MKTNYFRKYLREAPISQALWRSIECRCYSQLPLRRPLLDIGTGDGTFASLFFKGRVDAGIDHDIHQLRLARKKRAYKTLRLAQANGLPFKNNSFKTVLSNCVIEHVADQQATFDEIRRVLKPGGRLYFTVPSAFREVYSPFPWLRYLGLGFIGRLANRILRRVWMEDHFYTPSRWQRILRRSRLKLVSHSYYCSRAAYTVYGLFLPTAFLSYLCKKLFNRWLPLKFIRRFTTPGWDFLLRRFYLQDCPRKGAGLLLVAEKR